jgi:hypothetical protein
MKLIGIFSVDFGILGQIPDILHSSILEKKIGVQWDSTSVIYRFQEGI